MPETIDSVLTEVNDTRKDWTDKEWEAETFDRGLHHKFDKQLVDAKEALLENLNQIIESISNPEMWGGSAEQLIVLTERRGRIKEKIVAVDKEQELRAAGAKRTPVGTTYYIDYGSGNDANDGLSTGNAWKTINKYTSVTVRSPGDIAKLRANVVWDQGASGENKRIDYDENGLYTNYITMKGCDSVDDPWSDGSDVHPIIDFNGEAYNLYMGGRSYWHHEQIDVTGGSNTSQGQIYFSFSTANKFTSCKIYDGGGNYGVSFNSSLGSEWVDCEFEDSGTTQIVSVSSFPYFLRCSFDGGSTPAETALLIRDGCLLEDCEFGVNSQHSVRTIYHLPMSGIIYARNCKFNDATLYQRGSSYIHYPGAFVSEDHDQVYGAHMTIVPWGTVEKDTTIVRSGGAGSSAKITDLQVPISSVNPFRLGYNAFLEAFRVWCTANVAHTVTVYIRANSAWSTYPTAAELYVDASYYDNASDTTRSRSTASTQVLSDGSTWVAFTTTFTPLRDGWAFVNVTLSLREAGNAINVDIQPIVTTA